MKPIPKSGSIWLRTSAGRGEAPSSSWGSMVGWRLRALLPPPERRGVILIDPPFEEDGELDRLVTGLKEGLARFATGVFIAWYPIKDAKITRRLIKSVAEIAPLKLISLEVLIRQPRNYDRAQWLRPARGQPALYA